MTEVTKAARLANEVEMLRARVAAALELCDEVADVNGVPHVADKFRAVLTGGVVAAEEMPAFRRMLMLLKIQFDAGEIQRVPASPNGDAADLLYRMCERFGVR